MKQAQISLSLLLLAVLLIPVVPAGAQESLGVDPYILIGDPAGAPRSGEELDQFTDVVASLLRCPVCQGLSVADSPTASALAMKEEVRDLLAAGYDEEQVLSYFEQSYGEFIRLAPKPQGFNLVVWIAPVVFLLLGFVLVLRRVKSSSPLGEADAPVAEEQDDDLDSYRERVRREISS